VIGATVGSTGFDLVDAHCHIDLLGKDEGSVVEEIQRRPVHTIAVTNTPSVFFHTRDLAAKNRFLYPAVGLHPELVDSRSHELDRMWPLLAETRFVGEVGLDYVTSDLDLRRMQRDVFSAILSRCADYADKVITVHSRRSASDVVAAVGSNFPGTVILHWFSGTRRELEAAVTIGCWFSVNPAMFRSKTGPQLVELMPKDRLLTETDGPFVKIGSRGAVPPDALESVRGLAAAWNESVEDAAAHVFANFRRAIAKPASYQKNSRSR
jgi:TatD DNase family protein